MPRRPEERPWLEGKGGNQASGASSRLWARDRSPGIVSLVPVARLDLIRITGRLADEVTSPAGFVGRTGAWRQPGGQAIDARPGGGRA